MTIIEFLSEPLYQRLAMTLLHFLWQGFIIMSLVLAFFSLFKIKHCNVRYFIYLAAFIAMMACPLITFTALNIPIEKSASIAEIQQNNEVIEYSEPIYSESVTAPLSIDSPKTENLLSHEPKSILAAQKKQSISEYFYLSLPWFLTAWITGVLILSIRLLIGFFGVYRCRRNCKLLPERMLNSVKRMSNKLGMNDFTRVFISHRIVQAIAIGYLRPMVLIPASMLTQMTPEMLEAVIAHELAHIRRFDLWVNLIQRIAETLLFYHPAIWWLSNCIRTEREFCCDELAVQVTGHRLNYVSALENAGRISLMPKQLAFAESMCRDNKTLLNRVRYILGLTPTHKNNSSWITSIVTISLITLIIVSSALCFTEKASGNSDTDKNIPEYVQQIDVVIHNFLEGCKNNDSEDVTKFSKTKDPSFGRYLMQFGNIIVDSIGDEPFIPVKVVKIKSEKVNGAFFIAITENCILFNGNPSYITAMVHKVENEWLIENVTLSDQKRTDETISSIQKDYPDNYNIWEKESYTTPEESKNKILKEKLQTFAETKWKQLDDAPEEVREIAAIVRKWISADLANDIETFKSFYTANGQRYSEDNFNDLQRIVFTSPDWQFSPMIIRISESMAEVISNGFIIKPQVSGYDDIEITLIAHITKVDGKWGILTFSSQPLQEIPNSNFTRKYPDAQVWFDKSIPDWLNPLIKSNIESLKSTAQQILTETRENTLAEKLRAELGEQKIFESYFPDSAEGGKILDEWWSKREDDQEADKKIFDIVRNGLRTDGNGKPRQRRNQYFIKIGSKYIWGAGEQQNKDAIELLYYASFDPQLVGDVVYYGLSVTKEKSDKIMKRLVELCMEDVSIGRILWGTRGKHNDLLPYLKPYLESDSPEIKERAKVLEKVFNEELDYGKWSNEQLTKRLRDGLGDKLPEIKETLLNGASIQRKDILDLIRRNRLSLLFDSSFEEPLRACLSDGNPTVKEYAIEQYRSLFSKPGECPDEILDIMDNLSKDSDRKVREAAATFIGGNWIWGATPQNTKAIDIMYRLSSDKDREVRYEAVYYGLSVVENMNKKIIERLVELAMDESNDLGRIAWGLGNGGDMQIIKETLTPCLKPSSTYSQRAAQLYKELFKVDPPGISTEETNEIKTTENESSFISQLINSAQEGSVVTLPKGTYQVPVSINKTITLKGEDLENCIIEVTKNGPAINIDTKGVGKVTLENITIKWQLATSDQCELPYAVFVKDSEVIINNCSFLPLGNYQRCPVALRASGFSNMNVSNSRFEGYNYTVQYGEGTEGTFSHSIVTNSGHQGVTLYAGAKAAISGNIIAGSKYHGLRSTGGEFDVSNNLIIDNKNRGIYLGNKDASGTITNNLLINNTEGISGFPYSKLTINNNVISGSTFAALDMRDSCFLTIGNNIFVNNKCGMKMIHEGGTDNNTIETNTFWNNEKDLEDIKTDTEQVNASPQFIAPENGDYGLKDEAIKEQNQGLTNSQILKELWIKYQTIKTTEK